MSKSKKRIWTKSELVIAYYIAKWGHYGLEVSEYDLANFVIGDTTVQSLNMQTANFRHLLNLEGEEGGYKKLHNTSKLMKEIVDELDNKTISKVRKMIASFIVEREDETNILITKKNNSVVEKRRVALNAQLELDFDNKIAYHRRYRNLKKVEKLNK